MRWLLRASSAVLVLMLGPVVMWAHTGFVIEGNWSAASRASARLVPPAVETPEAVVQVYAARAFEWRGAFAMHTWLATKRAGAVQYTVHQVTGWGWRTAQSFPAAPDRKWFGHTPALLTDVRGERAAALIPRIEQAVARYPYAHRYRIWPGPNSNTFTAWVVRGVLGLEVAMPSTAIGKDYLPGAFFARAPSGTGYQVSLFGLFGVLLAAREGVEVNLLGLVFGVDPWPFAIKLPGLGRVGLPDAAAAQQVSSRGAGATRGLGLRQTSRVAAASAAAAIANSAR